MSLSKKKYSFHRRKSDKKENTINSQPLFTNVENNEIKENNILDLNQNITIDDLIYQNNNIKEENNKEYDSKIPLTNKKNIGENENFEKDILYSNPD